ncbi:MAG: hypothetical protein HY835_11300 [Anaerolineae bacterium]|nr:hypothetical protein [Anaerolineae bacterium]
MAPPEGYPATTEKWELSRAQLHAFIELVYTRFFESPELFGLPKGADSYLIKEGDEKDKKSELKRKYKQIHTVIDRGLDFLMQLGVRGEAVDDAMLVTPDAYADILQSSKVGKKFIQALMACGVEIQSGQAAVMVRHMGFPLMADAWAALAHACAEHKQALVGRFNFARCDFRALLGDYVPDALTLYRFFSEEEQAHLRDLHEFLLKLHYKPLITISEMPYWMVQYQGPRKIKSSPFFQVELSERYLNPLQVYVKLVSVDRLAPLMSGQPDFLQADLFTRAYKCNGDACGWCKTRPYVGPSVLEYKGQQRSVCWYSNPDLMAMDDQTTALVKQYALFHQELA